MVVLDVICSPDICEQAKFLPDRPAILEVGELLELSNGEFYINGNKIEGRWIDMRAVPVIKEK